VRVILSKLESREKHENRKLTVGGIIVAAAAVLLSAITVTSPNAQNPWKTCHRLHQGAGEISDPSYMSGEGTPACRFSINAFLGKPAFNSDLNRILSI